MVVVQATPGPWPLHLSQGIADVEHECPSCRSTFVVTAPLVADWLDLAGALAQDQSSRGVQCPACGRVVPFAAPLLQVRHGDVVDLVIGLPPDTDPDTDNMWIDAARSAFPDLQEAARVVPVRADWWQTIARAPLGPTLAGVVDPAVPASPEALRAWRASMRDLVPVAPVARGVQRLALEAKYAGAQAIAYELPELLQARWRTTVRAVAAALIDAQQDADARRLVEQRTLSRLRTLALFRGGAPVDLPDDVRHLIDSATVLAPSHVARLSAVTAAAEGLEAVLGESAEVAAALTSLARALYDSSSRGTAEIGEAVRIAGRAATIAEHIFDAEHDFVVMNRLNAFAMSADLLGPGPTEVVAAMEKLSAFAALPWVRESPHLPDALTNLAGLVNRRADIPRAARMELQLDLLAQAERAAGLLDPGNEHLRYVIATNIATTYGARVAGTKNTAAAAAKLRWTGVTENSLTLVDRLTRMTTEISIQFDEVTSTGRRDDMRAIIERCAQLRVSALQLGPGNEAAIKALSNSAAITGDLIRRLAVTDAWAAQRLAEALQTARDAVDRAAKHLGTTHAAHLTALVGLGNLQSQTPLPAPDSAARSRAAATYRRVADLAEGVSDAHVAVAWRNLGTLHFEDGRWGDAAAALAHAAAARSRLVEAAQGDDLILGEVADGEDLAGREAIAWVLAERPFAAVAAIERGRAQLLRRRLGILAADVAPSERPPVTTIHLSGSNIGTALIVRGPEGVRVAEVYALGAEVGAEAAALVRARSRASRCAALQRLGALVDPVVSSIVAATHQDADVRVIASGGWAGVPLHVLLRSAANPDGHPIVRYLPSDGVASALRARSTHADGDAVAFIDPDGDLTFAEHEESAFVRAHPGARTFAGPTTRSVALAAIAGARTIHLACHAQFDPDDPTRSHLSLGGGQRLTFADLLTAADADRLDLVVASACQSGASGNWNPDEMTAVAHGFLHSGARCVITALWDVNDLPAALLVCALYNSPSVYTDPATALSQAQDWLRTLTARTVDHDAPWLPAPLAERLRRYLARLDADQAPFAEGIDWGAFAYVGP